MSLLRRVGFYLGGFSIGLVLLAFFLSGKETSCSYGPTARVLKNIRIKQHEYGPGINSLLNSKTIDTADITLILEHGDVDFSRSNTKLDSCKTYLIEGFIKEKEVELSVANCDSIAKLADLKFLD